MSSGGEGQGGDGGGEEASGSESFAALLGEATPLEDRDTRLPPVSSRPRKKTPGARSSNSAAASSGARFRWPDPENRHKAAAPGVSDTQLAALSRGDPEPAERIDLHGARRDTASRLLSKRLESARLQGSKCVLVIHGRGQNSATGEAVLRDALPDWLSRGANARHVLAFSPAPNRLGGIGATLVLLRRP